VIITFKNQQLEIVDNHFIGQGIEPPPYETWLVCSDIIIHNEYVVANSSNHHDETVDYVSILKVVDFQFVGTNQEKLNFEKRCGKTFNGLMPNDSGWIVDTINSGPCLLATNRSLWPLL